MALAEGIDGLLDISALHKWLQPNINAQIVNAIKQKDSSDQNQTKGIYTLQFL